jgi:hypothetical protein
MEGTAMQSKALFVTMQAGTGNGDKVATWLKASLAPITEEPATRDWFALRFGPDTFAIFDTFDGNRGRLTHLLGKVGRGLVVRTFTMLSGLPDIAMADVVAARMPSGDGELTKAVQVQMIGCDRQSGEVAAGLRAIVKAENAADSALYALQVHRGDFLVLNFHTDTAEAVDLRRFSASCHEITAPGTGEILAYKLAAGALNPSERRSTGAAR